MLRDVEDILPQRDLTALQGEELHEICQGCLKVLEEVKQTLNRYEELDSDAKSLRGKSKKAFRSFQWDQKDIDQFRSRVTLNIVAFNAFFAKISR